MPARLPERARNSDGNSRRQQAAAATFEPWGADTMLTELSPRQADQLTKGRSSKRVACGWARERLEGEVARFTVTEFHMTSNRGLRKCFH
ncbi:hypothetical protein NDU88_006152 [Pleurodeles waltl]|uniref:Uncharacterized protein n=1 Tax=Pleurodeles waltl TaxID=8319 RepID=A0AAV7UP64_PLEWA|nr:hypothetical protein NDU88_006152 [Pleurodeles waltl]